jgi:hypothetical protein
VDRQHLRPIPLDVPIAEVRKLRLALGEVGSLNAENFWNGVEVQKLDFVSMRISEGLQRADAEWNADRIPKMRNYQKYSGHGANPNTTYL